MSSIFFNGSCCAGPMSMPVRLESTLYSLKVWLHFFAPLTSSSRTVPQELLAKMHSLQPRDNPINALETMALVGAYFSLPPSEISGSDVNHFGDNTAANGCVTCGYSKASDMARMASAHHLLISRLRTRVWIEWVPSASNVADLPSRPDEPGTLEKLAPLHATAIDFVLPSLSSWSTW